MIYFNLVHIKITILVQVGINTLCNKGESNSKKVGKKKTKSCSCEDNQGVAENRLGWLKTKIERILQLIMQVGLHLNETLTGLLRPFVLSCSTERSS